jgi:hypothetical protein
VLKRKQIKPLNQKIRNSFITEGNYRTACKGRGIRDPLRSLSNKILFYIFLPIADKDPCSSKLQLILLRVKTIDFSVKLHKSLIELTLRTPA